MDDWARNLPQSKPGTLFGVPLSKLRDANLQRMALMFLGAALFVAIFIPAKFSPLTFAWKGHIFSGMIWPLLAAASYLLVSVAPKDIRDKVPPVVLEWLPFGVSFIGVIVGGIGTISSEGVTVRLTFLYTIGISTLIFGLLARLQRPDDQAARIIITVGASLVLLGIFAGDGIDVDRESRSATITTNVLSHFDGKFAFGIFKGGVFKVYAILFLVVCLLAAACAVFVVPARKLPPALQAVDAFAPHVTAVLLLWLPVQIVIFFLALLIHGDNIKFVEWFLMLLRSLLTLLAYFGVLMLTAPAAYDALMGLFKKGPPPQGPPPGYGPPPGGPPPGYGPPQGGPPPGYGGPPPGGFGGPPPQGGPPGGWQPPQ